MGSELNIGDKAPDFSLEGDDGNTYSLESFKDKKLILYFYPKDNTPGCTTEACDFTEKRIEYENKGATIVGVSPDSIQKHKNFKEKKELDILLLSDPEKLAASAYGAFGEKKMYGKTVLGIIRSTFVIDENGIITNIYKNVRVKGHVNKVLEELS